MSLGVVMTFTVDHAWSPGIVFHLNRLSLAEVKDALLQDDIN